MKISKLLFAGASLLFASVPCLQAGAATPFPLSFYVGNPNASSATGEAAFDANFASFTAAMGVAPTYFTIFTDHTQSISAWPSNAGWAAASSRLSPSTAGKLPLIAVPLYSTAAGTPSPDAQFRAIAYGTYDTQLRGIVSGWTSNGFKTLTIRLGWEMNLQGTPYFGGADAQSQADWVKAFQHATTVLRAAAVTAGATIKISWNPGATNYSSFAPLTAVYPGNSYVDIISADMYSPQYLYSLWDWTTKMVDATKTIWASNPANLDYYWSYPAATEWSLDSSGGHAQSFLNVIAFARLQGKPFAVSETGTVGETPAFPQWLATTLQAAETSGVPIAYVGIWDSDGGCTCEWSKASDNVPLTKAAWAEYFGSQH